MNGTLRVVENVDQSWPPHSHFGEDRPIQRRAVDQPELHVHAYDPAIHAVVHRRQRGADHRNLRLLNEQEVTVRQRERQEGIVVVQKVQRLLWTRPEPGSGCTNTSPSSRRPLASVTSTRTTCLLDAIIIRHGNECRYVGRVHVKDGLGSGVVTTADVTFRWCSDAFSPSSGSLP